MRSITNKVQIPSSILVLLRGLLNAAYLLTISSLFILLFGIERGHNHVENFMVASIVFGFFIYLSTGEYNKIEKPIIYSMLFYGTVLFISNALHGDLTRLAKGFIFTPFFLIFAPKLKIAKHIIVLSSIFGSFLLSYITVDQYFSGIIRPNGYTNAILHSQALFIFFLFNFYFLLTEKNSFLKLICISNLIALSASIVLTQTRGVWLAFLVVTLVGFAYKFKKNLGKVLLSIASLLVSSFLIYNYTPIVHNKINSAISDLKKIEENNYNTSWGLRLLAWESAFIDIKKRFILGNGLDNFQANKVIQVQEGKISSQITSVNLQHAHNQYIQNLLIRGLLGLLALIFLLLTTFFLKSGKNIQLISTINLSYAVFSLSDVPFEHLNTTYLYLVSIAIIYLYLKEEHPQVKFKGKNTNERE